MGQPRCVRLFRFVNLPATRRFARHGARVRALRRSNKRADLAERPKQGKDELSLKRRRRGENAPGWGLSSSSLGRTTGCKLLTFPFLVKQVVPAIGKMLDTFRGSVLRLARACETLSPHSANGRDDEIRCHEHPPCSPIDRRPARAARAGCGAGRVDRGDFVLRASRGRGDLRLGDAREDRGVVFVVGASARAARGARSPARFASVERDGRCGRGRLVLANARR